MTAPMLTAEELAQRTGASARWWREQARLGRVEHSRHGRMLRFPAHLVDQARHIPTPDAFPASVPCATGLSPRSRIARQAARR